MVFAMPTMAFAVLAFIGMVMAFLFTGTWWPLALYVGYWAFFFVLLEIRILCSHCPFYAEGGRILHCHANHGLVKLWRYHPEPMGPVERGSLIVCLGLFAFIPVAFQAYGVWYLASGDGGDGPVSLLVMATISIATLLVGVAYLAILMTALCTRCVNFSCPLNRVPKRVVDEYLRRNPVMREAWEGTGYRLG